MALRKDKYIDIDLSGDYHRILQLNCNYDRMDAVCTVGTYISQSSREGGGSPKLTFQVDLAGEFHNKNYQDGEDVMKNISLKEAYKALKKMAVDEAAKPEDERRDDLAFYADAVDV